MNENSKIPTNSTFVVTKLSQAQGKLEVPEHRTEKEPPEQQGDLKRSMKSFTFKASLLLSKRMCSSSDQISAEQLIKGRNYKKNVRIGGKWKRRDGSLLVWRKNSWCEGKIQPSPVTVSALGKAKCPEAAAEPEKSQERGVHWNSSQMQGSITEPGIPQECPTPRTMDAAQKSRVKAGNSPWMFLWAPGEARSARHLQALERRCSFNPDLPTPGSVEFLQTLLIWHIQDGTHVRKASDTQIADLHHAPDDLTGLLTPSQSTNQENEHSHPKTGLGEGWLFPEPTDGTAGLSKAGADTGTMEQDQNKYHKKKKKCLRCVIWRILHLKNPICSLSDFKRASAGTRRMFSLLPQADRPWVNSCLHTLELQKPSHERQGTSEVTPKHNLPKAGSTKITLCVNRVCWRSSYRALLILWGTGKAQQMGTGVSSAMGLPRTSTPARDGAVWRKYNAKQSPDQLVLPFGEQLKGHRWGMVVSWHVGNCSFGSGGDLSSLNQLPAPSNAAVGRKPLSPARLSQQTSEWPWEGLQWKTCTTSPGIHVALSVTGSCLSFATSKIKWSDLFLSACDGHPSILLFSIIFSFRFIIRAISDH